jgi:hypothetical protein
VVLVVGLLTQWAWGATPSLTRQGVPVRWASRQPQFAANPMNASGISPREVFSSFTRALQRWQQASQGRLDFQYWQGSDRPIYEPASQLNGYSTIYFASQAETAVMALDSSILGLTQVWFDSESGEILETDIVLNDRDYRFSVDSVLPAAQERVDDGLPLITLDNVITHELGHAFGLAHSGAMQSTMFFAEGPDQAYPGCDDQVGIARVYPPPDSAGRGNLELEVRSPSGQPIIGAQVHAISRSRGVVFAGALSDSNGKARVSALEPGVYDLLIEPYQAGTGALPEYYRSALFSVCSGRPFSRSWPGRSGNLLSGFRVEAGTTLDLGSQQVSCPQAPGADVESSRGSAERGSAPSLREGQQAGFSWLDRADAGESDHGSPVPRFYRLKLHGELDLKILSFSAFSPIRVRPTLRSQSGETVPVRLESPVYRGESGFVNHDLRLQGEGLLPGDYELELRFDSLAVVDFPAGALARDRVPFFLLIESSAEDAEPPLSAVHPLNSRCRQQEDFPEYQSPPGTPPRRSAPLPAQEASTGCARGSGASGLSDASGLLLLGAMLRQLPAWLKRLTLKS